MSFYSVEQSTPRLHRSELAVPGSRPELFEKASTSKLAISSTFLNGKSSSHPKAKLEICHRGGPGEISRRVTVGNAAGRRAVARRTEEDYQGHVLKRIQIDV